MENQKLEKIVNQKDFFARVTGTLELMDYKTPSERVEKARFEHIGKYCSNNGVIAFVDENRDYWIAKNTKEAEDALKNAGYTLGSVYVPHSNDGGKFMREYFESYKARSYNW
jgi:hypothetical protein